MYILFFIRKDHILTFFFFANLSFSHLYLSIKTPASIWANPLNMWASVKEILSCNNAEHVFFNGHLLYLEILPLSSFPGIILDHFIVQEQDVQD